MPLMPGTHRPAGQRPLAARRRDDDRRRGSAHARGYDTRWARASRGYLDRHPLCPGCEAVGRVEPAVLTDHVVPHRGDKRLFWDRSNWQGACGWHHSAVKQRLEQSFAAGLVDAAALRLDSAAAIALTRSLLP